MILFYLFFLLNFQEKNSGILYLQSQIAADSGEYDKSIKYLEDALKSDPDSAFLKLELAKVLILKESFSKAIEIIESFSPPENLKAVYFSLKFYLDLMVDDIESAFKDYEELKNYKFSNEEKIYIIEAIERKIEYYIGDENPNYAIKLLEIYIQYFPQKVKILEILMGLYLQNNDFKKASNLVKNMELNEETFSVISSYLYYLNDINDCENILFLKEKLIDSDKEVILSAFPYCLINYGSIEEAVKVLEKLISLNSENEVALNLLLELKIINGDYERAEEILKLFPKDTEEQINVILENKALLYQTKGEYQKAEEILFKLLNKFESKERVRILKKIYYFYNNTGNCNKALEYSFKILDEDRMDFYSYYRIAEAYLLSGDVENALLYLETYNEFSGPESFVDSIWILLEYGYTEEAYPFLEELNLFKNKIKQINQLWGFFYFKKNEIYKMEETLIKDFEDPSSLNLLGYFFIEKDIKIDGAIALLEKALKYNPYNGSIIDSLGWGYFKKGDLKNSYEILKRAIFLEPYNGIILTHLGDVALKLGNYEEALLRYRQAISFQKPDMGDVFKKIDEVLRKIKEKKYSIQ